MPMTPFMGVRISWLMLARNSLLAALAASALDGHLARTGGGLLEVAVGGEQGRLHPLALGDVHECLEQLVPAVDPDLARRLEDRQRPAVGFESVPSELWTVWPRSVTGHWPSSSGQSKPRQARPTIRSSEPSNISAPFLFTRSNQVRPDIDDHDTRVDVLEKEALQPFALPEFLLLQEDAPIGAAQEDEEEAEQPGERHQRRAGADGQQPVMGRLGGGDVEQQDQVADVRARRILERGRRDTPRPPAAGGFERDIAAGAPRRSDEAFRLGRKPGQGRVQQHIVREAVPFQLAAARGRARAPGGRVQRLLARGDGDLHASAAARFAQDVVDIRGQVDVARQRTADENRLDRPQWRSGPTARGRGPRRSGRCVPPRAG